MSSQNRCRDLVVVQVPVIKSDDDGSDFGCFPIASISASAFKLITRRRRDRKDICVAKTEAGITIAGSWKPIRSAAATLWYIKMTAPLIFETRT